LPEYEVKFIPLFKVAIWIYQSRPLPFKNRPYSSYFNPAFKQRALISLLKIKLMTLSVLEHPEVLKRAGDPQQSFKIPFSSLLSPP